MKKHLIAIVALLLGATPMAINAQEAGELGDGNGDGGFCVIRTDDCEQGPPSIGRHTTIYTGLGGLGGNPNHGGCYQCSDSGGPTDSYECHPCWLAPEPEGAFKSLLVAASSQDIESMLKAVRQNSHMISLNKTRSAVQILSCNRETLQASISVTSSDFARFEKALVAAKLLVVAQIVAESVVHLMMVV